MADTSRVDLLLALEDVTFAERALALIWYEQRLDPKAVMTIPAINEALVDAGYARQHSTRLRVRLERDKRTIKVRGGFQIRVQSWAEVETEFGPIVGVRRTPRHRLRVLFASSDPDGDVRAEREQRALQEAMERSALNNFIDVDYRFAVSYASLSRALRGPSYDVVHISSHGSEDGVWLDGEFVSPDDLAELFAEYVPPRRALKCVILNACWSTSFGRPTTSIVPLTICMDGEVGSLAAQMFTEGFYDALGVSFDDYAAAFREGGRWAKVRAANDPFSVFAYEYGKEIPSVVEGDSSRRPVAEVSDRPSVLRRRRDSNPR